MSQVIGLVLCYAVLALFPTAPSLYMARLRIPAGRIATFLPLAGAEWVLAYAEEQLLRAQRQEAAGKVAGQVAHDFNNMLAPILMYPDLIRAEFPPDHPAQAYCDSMTQVAKEMAILNSDLLALGRRSRIEDEEVNLNEMVREAKKQLGHVAPGRTLTLRLDPDLPPIWGSSAQLLRVVMNLAINAFDATADDGTVTIETKRLCKKPDGRSANGARLVEQAQVSVVDNGYSVPDEIRGKLFEPFFTTKRTDRRRGSGLGLSVVQATVEDHRGAVELDTEVGKGSAFQIILPATPEVKATKRPVSPADVPRGKERILVVDDDPPHRKATAVSLTALGYQVEEASSGEQALVRLRERPTDLLVLDYAMPGGMDGVETFRHALEISPSQKGILLSGYPQTEVAEAAVSIGIKTYIQKPVPLDKLARVVREELDRSA